MRLEVELVEPVSVNQSYEALSAAIALAMAALLHAVAPGSGRGARPVAGCDVQWLGLYTPEGGQALGSIQLSTMLVALRKPPAVVRAMAGSTPPASGGTPATGGLKQRLIRAAWSAQLT